MNKKQKPASELMPKDKKAIHILQKRANLFAKQEVDVNERNGIAFIRFELSPDESYGVPYPYVQDILNNVILAKPPFIPYFVAGILNWRGSLITIIDLFKFFHSKSTEHTSLFIIVIHAKDSTVGLLVHRVDGSAYYQPTQLSPPLSLINVAKPKYILGLHEANTAILDVDILISGLNEEIKKSVYRMEDIHGGR